jgi:hypothetical protein
MQPVCSVSFAPPKSSWLFGHLAHRSSRRVAVLSLILAALCLFGAAGAWFHLREELSAQREIVLAAQNVAKRNAMPAALVAKTSVVSPAERMRVNRIVRRLNMPWSSIFASLENQALPGVAVLSLEPDVERGAVRVSTEGPSLDELLRHAARVQEAPHFSQTQLLRIDPEETRGGPEVSRLSFDLILVR